MGCAPSKPAPTSPSSTNTTTTTAITTTSTDDPTRARSNAIVSEPTASFSLGASGFSLRYACVSQRGYNPDDLYEASQDAYGVVRDGPMCLLGVFDGHGPDGTDCAQFARREFGRAFASANKKAADDRVGACKAAMLSLNQQLINTDDVDASYSGTTAITAWFEGSRLHVCNVSATIFLFYSAARCSLTKRSLSL